MSKLNKKVKTLIAAGVVLVLLTAALVVVLLTVGKDPGDSSDVSSTVSDPSITLIDQKQENVKNIKVTNQSGTYEIALSGDKAWKIAALDYAQDESMLSNAAQTASVITADSVLLEKQENLAEYGLDKPETVVVITYKDGTTFQMNLGIETPDGSGRYMTAEGKEPIYIYSASSASTFEYKAYDYLDTTIIDAIKTDETSSGSQAAQILADRMEISRPDLKKPFIMSKVENAGDTSMASYASYQITSPVTVAGNDEKISPLVSSLLSLNATSVVKLNPTASERKQYGFDKPAAVLKLTYEGVTYVLRVGNAVTCEATDNLDDLESGHQHTTTGHLVMLDGKNVVFEVSEMNLSFLTIKPEDLYGSFVVIPNISDVKRVTIGIDGKTHTFDLTHSKDADSDSTDLSAVKYNNSTSLSAENFKNYYQLMLGITISGSNDKTPSGTPKLTIQYDYIDSSKKSDKLELFDSGTGAIIIRCNGEANFLTRLSYVNRVIQSTDLLLQNKEIDPS